MAVNESRNPYTNEWAQWLSGKKYSRKPKLTSTSGASELNQEVKLRVILLVFFIVFVVSVVGITFYTFSQNLSIHQIENNAQTTVPFRAKLNDRDGNPISTKTDVIFRLYYEIDTDVPIYEGSCQGEDAIEPDFNGEFTILLGSDCGMDAIPSDIFSQETPLFLGIQVGTAEEILPRYQIRTSSYSMNASMLEGRNLGTESGDIPFLNDSNTISLNDPNPSIISTNGMLSIEGASLSLKTNDSLTGNILILPAPSRSVIVPNGSVGVGTLDPQSKLDVSSKIDDDGSVVNISDLSISSVHDKILLSLGVGSTENENIEFITFNINSTQSSSGEQVGSISLEENRVVYKTSGADYAEYFMTVEDIPDRLIVGLGKSGIRRAQESDIPIGIVSTQAGFVGNSLDSFDNDGFVTLVGLVGQVDVLVSDLNGDIEMGDRIQISDIPGVGMRGEPESHEVGYSLTSFSRLKISEFGNSLCPKEHRKIINKDGYPVRCAVIQIVLK